MSEESSIIPLTIIQLAALGDGMAMHEGLPVFVPYTLPNERITARILSRSREGVRAELLEVITPSPERKAPECRHFTVCGGCELQHLSEEAYVAFKRNIALQVAKRLGVDESRVAPLLRVPAHSRRRAELKVSVSKGVVTLGYMAARSHTIVDIHECPVAEPAIENTLEPWRGLLTSLKSPSNIKSIHMTVADGGLAVLLQVVAKTKQNDRDLLTIFAQKEGFLSLSEQVFESGEPMPIHRGNPVQVIFGGVPVELTAGAFLQATKPSEEALVSLVLARCEGYGNIVDLYSGCGTFTFPLATAGHVVTAFEGAGEMVTAGFNAARRAGLENTARFAARDLFKSPVKADELRVYDAAVINPPRNGALPQVKELALAGVGRIVMVSCNPVTFERDAKHLLENGYALDSFVPVDQFLWSHHLEVVGIFSKDNAL